MQKVPLATEERRAVMDVTGQVETAVAASRVRDGIALVFCPHTTAAVVVNEMDGRLEQDLLAWAAKAVPEGAGWRHDAVEANAHAHLQGISMNQAATLPVVGGRLALGTWQHVLFVELDGPRQRELWVQVVGR
jgi:secondary thiamine-phosphate synthase enzyme